MSFGLGIREALGGAAKGASIGSAIPGLGTAAGGAIGGGLGLLSGLFGGGSSIEDQKELMEKAWEYEKEGMGIQYQYGQEAAKAAQQRFTTPQITDLRICWSSDISQRPASAQDRSRIYQRQTNTYIRHCRKIF